MSENKFHLEMLDQGLWRAGHKTNEYQPEEKFSLFTRDESLFLTYLKNSGRSRSDIVVDLEEFRDYIDRSDSHCDIWFDTEEERLKHQMDNFTIACYYPGLGYRVLMLQDVKSFRKIKQNSETYRRFITGRTVYVISTPSGQREWNKFPNEALPNNNEETIFDWKYIPQTHTYISSTNQQYRTTEKICEEQKTFSKEIFQSQFQKLQSSLLSKHFLSQQISSGSWEAPQYNPKKTSKVSDE